MSGLPTTESLAAFKSCDSEGGRSRASDVKTVRPSHLPPAGLTYLQCVELLNQVKASEGEATNLLGQYSSPLVRVSQLHGREQALLGELKVAVHTCIQQEWVGLEGGNEG